MANDQLKSKKNRFEAGPSQYSDYADFKNRFAKWNIHGLQYQGRVPTVPVLNYIPVAKKSGTLVTSVVYRINDRDRYR